MHWILVNTLLLLQTIRSRCSAGGNFISGTLIRSETTLQHLHHRYWEHGFDAVAFRTIRPTLMGHFFTWKAILQPPHTTGRWDVVLAATPNQPSSGRWRACSTVAIDIESMALMLWPSVLSAPTLMGHFYTSKAILQPPHTTRRWDVVLAATPNQPSSGQRRGCSLADFDLVH